MVYLDLIPQNIGLALDKVDWGHWETDYEVIPEDSIGFLYKITNKATDKFYFGIKLLYKKIKRPPLKGKKRKRISQVESDWRTYCSSSGKIRENVESNETGFKFELLSFHESKTTLKISETKKIIEFIYDPMCYNEMVNIRLRVPKEADSK